MFFYFRSKADLPLWSYYLKTLILQMVIEKPDKKFWSNGNVFSAFNACLTRLYTSVLNRDLYDTFDNRLKLLSLVPDDDLQEGPFDGAYRKKMDEGKAKMGETCRKFLKLKDYIAITGILKDITSGLQISMTNGINSSIEFLQTRVFRLKQFDKLWSKVELSILDNLTKDPDKLKIELESVVGRGRSKSGKRDDSLLVASPEFRKRWKPDSKWTKYTDIKEEYQMFMKNIVSKDFQSEIIVFRSYLFQEDLMSTKCTWCGTIYTNSEHIFWECSKVKEFWQEYAFKPGKWNKAYEMDDIDKFVYDLLNPQNLDLCSHENNQDYSTKEHKIHVLNMTKEYLIICQKVEVIPSQQELDCQLKAMIYSKNDSNLHRKWFQCPLPPQRGKQIVGGFDYQIHQKLFFHTFQVTLQELTTLSI